ncbi:MAG: bacillithiol biosynthesis deacetylase BshB1 [Algoriphagus sp.]|jgi:bacillithiol biosynthesis deacetylase BshB1|uniref:bacillithiol biosynthesis deacetylase BshB1 n=1 Tax=Algoriphagus sp. TaxID=1872435 RepID=UPI00271A1848|nr:bacillithiol biosynthesis deacetylase BshB1 [Algoriphagus sp.]MDO8965793.1 bacillithiol biosynthesis deacetylase BshB1 [Algoriphagus sp.]MDP2042497.1 bacillithiol biosynthesis deacetylase BshB1 [Algoriphagus sp.]MDP3198888.1 bacillithiol biosynthesis deacetylase BshB1 [Algoriphagus sp.]MDP3473825.1 bacillithiol biosynthesis deacetylase BshB1 [Algoriphagus sp.]
MTKLDILVIAAHPDDAELGCAGTIAAHVAKGLKVGIVDLTRGEMGTRGTPETRIEEAEEAAKILGLSARENLGFEDIYFKDDTKHQHELIKIIRKYQPEIVLANAVTDRHPDHGKGASLATHACFMSGLRKIETSLEEQPQDPWRPKFVYHYIQNNYIQPDFIVDVSEFWEIKIASIMAFKSQFYDPGSQEPTSFISSPEFLPFIESRARELGHRILTKYGEGFTVERFIGVSNLFDLK